MKTSDFFGLTPLSDNAFSELLPDFFTEIEDDLKSLTISFNEKDWIQVRQISHKIKGTAASYSAKLIFDAAKNLQDKLEDNYSEVNTNCIAKLELAIRSSHNYAKENIFINKQKPA